MSTPILATKLYHPRLRPNMVSRKRLIERLNAGLHRKLTLICAPAGFGKTTLVSEWTLGLGRPIAWLSLDEGENDATRFLTYLVAALQTIAPGLGKGVLGALQSPQPPPSDLILTTLLNELTTIPDQIVLVLDDYHLIEAQAVDQALAFLSEHLPSQIHLVIVTREDPRLPLARLRARDHVTELRAADLRFTTSEAVAFLNQMMGLTLSAEDVTALERRTEGWIAGLQLAALSLQGQEDATSLIASFTGSHHFVLDYLMEEVLGQQSEHIQTFLLHTSIFDRMSGSLCDAVVLDSTLSGQATLQDLERANLFLIPLDDHCPLLVGLTAKDGTGCQALAVGEVCHVAAGECRYDQFRLFLDEGLPMASLLSEAMVLGNMPDYIRKVLTAKESICNLSLRLHSVCTCSGWG